MDFTIFLEYAAEAAICPICGKPGDVYDQQLLRLSWWQTQEIMKASVERGLARREGEEITFVGLDEKSFLKGMKSDAFACIMTDIS